MNYPFKYLNIKYVNNPFKYLILIVLGGRWVRMVELILLLVSDCSPVEDGLQFIDEGLWRKLIVYKYVELELTTRNWLLTSYQTIFSYILVNSFWNPSKQAAETYIIKMFKMDINSNCKVLKSNYETYVLDRSDPKVSIVLEEKWKEYFHLFTTWKLKLKHVLCRVLNTHICPFSKSKFNLYEA